MTIRRALIAGSFAFFAVAAATGAIAMADEPYTVSGSDTFRVGNGDVHSRTVYQGTETLSIVRTSAGTTYVARVEYDRDGDGAKLHQTATFTSTLLPSGEMRDGSSHDPDYLTVLNQPFAVQLDRPTMRDLHKIKRAVPFDFPSPMTGAPLRGTLRRLADATVSGVKSMGIAFEARGPLHGALPDRPAMALAGTITMTGTAYYSYDTALLVALDAKLGIDGNIDDVSRRAPVAITYVRSIRAIPSQQARTPQPRRT
ncbi:hypothetical protein WPS_09900 [Vulcanimicrobium alpinum]|uniref:DUF3108 domain-containing protein n=1 Tax=Vulcanimicrobium alpinum TaxID=3016050 RepID=A0AAN2C8X0_UNVUL|nr:hypothetical protein [Vulcanimicrobium alpinum]BDE05714.1 hypothetical protein WPS_09900 [Vulcanimicrobium alpinum]